MKHILLIICFVLTLTVSFGQVKKLNDEEIVRIGDIRQKFKLINEAIGSSVMKSIDIMDASAEGGEMNLYYQENEIRKVEAIYYGETGKLEIDYYLWNKEVFFIFQKDFHYNSLIYISEAIPEEGIEAYDEAKTVMLENRYYFNKGHMIRWVNNEKKMLGRNDVSFIEKQEEILENIEFLKEKIFK